MREARAGEKVGRPRAGGKRGRQERARGGAPPRARVRQVADQAGPSRVRGSPTRAALD